MRSGTITGAAQALNVSQPALSQTLLHAESELGFKLFERIKGRLIPTAEAEDLFPDVDRIFGDLESLRRRAHDLRRGRGGLIRLASSAPAALSILPNALRAFRAAHADVRVSSFIVPVDTLTKMLDQGQVGLGVAMYNRPLPFIETEMLGSTAIVCVLPADHRLASREVVTADDLKQETIISYRLSSLPGELLNEALARQGTGLYPDIEIDVSLAAMGLVQANLGVALVDGLLPWSVFRGLTTRPFVPHVELPLCILTSANRSPALNYKIFRKFLVEACATSALIPSTTAKP